MSGARADREQRKVRDAVENEEFDYLASALAMGAVTSAKAVVTRGLRHGPGMITTPTRESTHFAADQPA